MQHATDGENTTTNQAISLNRAISIPSVWKEELEKLARKLVQEVYAVIVNRNDIRIAKYFELMEKYPDKKAWFNKLVLHHASRSHYAHWLSRSAAFSAEIYALLLREIDTDGRVISLVPTLRQTRTQDDGVDSGSID